MLCYIWCKIVSICHEDKNGQALGGKRCSEGFLVNVRKGIYKNIKLTAIPCTMRRRSLNMFSLPNVFVATSSSTILILGSLSASISPGSSFPSARRAKVSATANPSANCGFKRIWKYSECFFRVSSRTRYIILGDNSGVFFVRNNRKASLGMLFVQWEVFLNKTSRRISPVLLISTSGKSSPSSLIVACMLTISGGGIGIRIIVYMRKANTLLHRPSKIHRSNNLL